MKGEQDCPVCGQGPVSVQETESVVRYKGREGHVLTRMKCCQACGSEYADAETSRRNKRATIAFRKSVDGLLSGQEIRALRRRYGLTQAQAARLFGGGPVAFSKYENDDVAHSESMDKLLRLAAQSAGVVEHLARQARMQPSEAAFASDAKSAGAALEGRVCTEMGGGEVIHVNFATYSSGSEHGRRSYRGTSTWSEELRQN